MNPFFEMRVPRSWMAAVLTTTLLVAGCQDLQVENLTSPDRERATQNPSDVQAFIGGAFYPTFHNAINTTLALSLWPVAGSEFTTSLFGIGSFLWYRDLVEPRLPHDNGEVIPGGNGPHGPRNYWSAIGRSASIPYDGLRFIKSGMKFTEGTTDVTARAEAFAKFMQAWSWAYAALIFDKVHIWPETLDLPSDPKTLMEVNLTTLVPYTEAVAPIVASLEAAIAIARANPTVVQYPSLSQSPFWFGSATPISNAQFIRMANTLAARVIVLNARTPQERAQVDWNKVLQLTAEGIMNDADDFNMQLNSSRVSGLIQRATANTATGSPNMRWHNRAIGPSDQSGAYQDWIAKPTAQRTRFNIVTPDRRITGTTPTSDGSYTRYRADNNGFDPDRGIYFQSAYQWARHQLRNNLPQNNAGQNVGIHPLITADENRLLRAEALLRTGDIQGAIQMVNITRTRTQTIGTTTHPGLPPMTSATVPTVNGQCVPRQDNGACGTLMDAIRYERMIELAGMDVLRGYTDARGFGMLPDGALLSFPVPGNVLVLYGMEQYTYGGAGTSGSAVYAPVH